HQLCLIIFAVLFTALSICIIADQSKSEEECRLDIQNIFTASGWMGDGEYGRKYIEFEGAYKTDPHSQPTCIRIKYTFGPKRWAGIYWQNKPDNWGDRPGNNYSKKGLKKITFWAKGETGKEVVEFKAGDIYNKNLTYHDSFSETIGRVILPKVWKKYTINLEGADLSSVIGGFCWTSSRDYNSQNRIIFYIDDICFN
ncbi:MAG: hypothetical protein V3U91_05150, partial [Candidatus Aminicenantaceae bacterium]